MVLLEMASGDPLRAVEIEETVTELWWARWEAWQEFHAKKNKDSATRHRQR